MGVALWQCLLILAGILMLMVVPARVRAEELPPAAMIDDVVGRPQQRNLSCESRSAVDLAAYWGTDIAEDAFFRRLPKSDDPHRGFVGDVDMPAGSMPPAGYGVYAEPIAASLRSFGLGAEAHRGIGLKTLKEQLAAQRPVIVWATYDMQLPGAEIWISSDGVQSTVVRWQHTFVAVGYDAEGLHLIDAFDGVLKYYAYEAFVPAWDQLGQMAVTVAGPLTRPSQRTWVISRFEDRAQFVVDGRWEVAPR